MSQELADRQQIDSRFEHAGRVRVPQSMGSDILADCGLGHRQLACLLNRGSRKGRVRRLARKKIVAWPLEFPILAKLLQQPWRDGHDSFFASFSVGDTDLSPLAVDVGDAEMGGFGQPQPCCVASQ
jgi:hypothetical protein